MLQQEAAVLSWKERAEALHETSEAHEIQRQGV